MIVWFEDQNLLNIYIYMREREREREREIHPLNLIEWTKMDDYKYLKSCETWHKRVLISKCKGYKGICLDRQHTW